MPPVVIIMFKKMPQKSHISIIWYEDKKNNIQDLVCMYAFVQIEKLVMRHLQHFAYYINNTRVSNFVGFQTMKFRMSVPLYSLMWYTNGENKKDSLHPEIILMAWYLSITIPILGSSVYHTEPIIIFMAMFCR